MEWVNIVLSFCHLADGHLVTRRDITCPYLVTAVVYWRILSFKFEPHRYSISHHRVDGRIAFFYLIYGVTDLWSTWLSFVLLYRASIAKACTAIFTERVTSFLLQILRTYYPCPTPLCLLCSLIWGSPYWWDFLACDCLTTVQVAIFRFREWCVLGVFL